MGDDKDVIVEAVSMVYAFGSSPDYCPMELVPMLEKLNFVLAMWDFGSSFYC